MRILIGLMLLGSLFLLAALWQRGFTERLQDERRLRHGVPMARDLKGEGWARLVLGRPSGEDPLPAPQAMESAPPPSLPAQGEVAAPPPVPDYPPDYQYEVAPGDVLGRICQAHYQSDLPLLRIVEAVAAYNHLGTEDGIRSGEVLLLPDLRILFPDEASSAGPR